MIALFQYYRIISAFLIVLIHQQFWTVPLVPGRFTIAAVPLFSAMAGFLFAKTLTKDFEIKVELIKKVRRILIPYVIWAVVYWIANSVVLDVLIRHESFNLPSLRSWLLGGTACHLWFLPCLFTMFVVFALMDRIAIKSNIRLVWFAVMILVLSGLSQLIPDVTSTTLGGYVRIYFGRCAFYFALGTIMYQLDVSKSIALYSGGGGILLGCINVALQLLSGLIWNPLLLVIGLMLIAQHFHNIKLPRWGAQLSEASMGIYLVHVLFTSGANFALQKIGHLPLPSIIGFALSLLIFAVSFFTVRLIPKKFL